jgi:hypothetical protein
LIRQGPPAAAYRAAATKWGLPHPGFFGLQAAIREGLLW